jgi:phenylpropionate dioxygenase-like ring-hydroxylating dioxygenase large terminal subunit
MIPNQWYAILESREVKRGKLTRVTRMGENLVAWRDTKNRIVVMVDKCPHRGASFRTGVLQGDCIQCPFHGFKYDSSGKCTLIPANGVRAEPPKALHVRRYEAWEEHDLIYIWWGEHKEKYPPVPWFESIPKTMVHATLKDHWSTHYSRAIENQLDVVHLPFVHRTTIGRGNHTLVNGPIVKEENLWAGDHLINLWVDNQVDVGQKPRRASEFPEPNRRPQLQFRFGNLWQNWIADGIRIVIAFAPVDNENTILYLQYYHTVRFPGLRQIHGWLGNLMNLVIERQDRRVVVTQRPHRPDLGIREVLIQGDGPIILYRKIRKTLIEEAGM